MDRNTILGKLPAFSGDYDLIHPDQNVHDIISEVLDAHKFFAGHYDKIALCFDDDSTEEICKNLFSFCKKNFSYLEQDEDTQQTMSPAAMITLKKVDCKNYSGFCGGVLDALNRLTSRKINWCYRFASYRTFSKTPHHVFIVVNPGANEIWIDPTPGADQKNPTWQADKKIKAGNMALYRVSGTDNNEGDALGFTNPWMKPKAKAIITDGTIGDYKKVFGPFLGWDRYGGGMGDGWGEQVDIFNAEIQKGPAPGHTFPADFYKWIFETENLSWNFYYPGGVVPGFNPSAILPADFPRLVLTDDLRLTFDKIVPLGYSPAFYVLMSWAQAMINEYDTTPYPLKPYNFQGFTQGGEGGIEKMNLFNEHKGKKFFTQVGDVLQKVVDFVKEGVLKIVGSIPRNAFLGLVGINAFNMAGSLLNKINGGQWDEIANTWRKVGGNPDKLLNTIEHGSKQKAVIGAAPAIPAWLAAAAPIIAIMLKYLDKDGKLTEVLSATKGFISTKYPGIDVTAFGFLDKKTGQPVQIVIDPSDDENQGGGDDSFPGAGIFGWVKDNPITAAAVGLAAWQLFAPQKYKLIK